MSEWINFNGAITTAETAIITARSRAFRYGDGLFETMRVGDHNIELMAFHFERLRSGLKTLQISVADGFDDAFLEKQIWRTINKNGIGTDARVRLAVFRGEGGLYEMNGQGAGFVVEAWPLQKRTLNESGLGIGVYEGAKKSCDTLANIKSNNYLVYVMAALHAKARQWNDCLVLNNYDRICDGTIANVFWIKDQKIFTPPLTEGCVAGVMRRHLLNVLSGSGFGVEQLQATGDILKDADEIFLTNAINGISWVKSFDGKQYGNGITSDIFAKTF